MAFRIKGDSSIIFHYDTIRHRKYKLFFLTTAFTWTLSCVNLNPSCVILRLEPQNDMVG